MRLLTRGEIELIWTIDRSEVHQHIYEVDGGELVRTPNYFEVPGWRADAPVKETALLCACCDRRGRVLGVVDEGALIAVGVLEPALGGHDNNQLQLAYLSVSRSY